MIHFGTGGWRAIIGDEFTKANLQLLAAGLCRLMDEEGLQTMRNLGRNMAWFLKIKELSLKEGIELPVSERVHHTNFI